MASTNFNVLVEEPQSFPPSRSTNLQNHYPNEMQVSSYINDITGTESYSVLKRIYYSPVYKYFYLFLLISTAILTIWLIIDYKNVRSILSYNT